MTGFNKDVLVKLSAMGSNKTKSTADNAAVDMLLKSSLCRLAGDADADSFSFFWSCVQLLSSSKIYLNNQAYCARACQAIKQVISRCSRTKAKSRDRDTRLRDIAIVFNRIEDFMSTLTLEGDHILSIVQVTVASLHANGIAVVESLGREDSTDILDIRTMLCRFICAMQSNTLRSAAVSCITDAMEEQATRDEDDLVWQDTIYYYAEILSVLLDASSVLNSSSSWLDANNLRDRVTSAVRLIITTEPSVFLLTKIWPLSQRLNCVPVGDAHLDIVSI